MKQIILIALGLITLSACKKDSPSSSGNKYISKVFDYLPAPGQFVNEEGAGTPAAAQLLIGNKNNLVSLGGYGGYIVFGFDHSIANSEGYDIAIYGNAVNGAYEWSEPGIVMVSQDTNGNGLPDDNWYELAGSQYDSTTTLKNYSITYYNPRATADVTWKDNKGNTGVVLVNASHQHSYYPSFASNQDSITFTGTLLRSTFTNNGGIYINSGFAWGYSDNYSAKDNYQANHYNSFDIDWAVDANGNKVTLKTADFVKVYTGQNNQGTAAMGEVSTEFGGAADLHVR
ncbi:hypothetical protein SAMN05518672_1011078 [Chitinophaga sp. CF118]|uniref:PKD domain-containing protein n=1 Tax=Chitinophaga sp. CF118 TaxID=1884367 RepID=UPI0008E72722|nr:PKD domain-containing protein [Chitinophaga sp. CF118]SFD21380.1 hypothetical protein SAMN05518672_1011078 [Chitinophaga sp. CF118]